MTGVRPKVVRIVQSWPGEDEKKGKNGAFAMLGERTVFGIFICLRSAWSPCGSM